MKYNSAIDAAGAAIEPDVADIDYYCISPSARAIAVGVLLRNRETQSRAFQQRATGVRETFTIADFVACLKCLI